MVYEYAHWLLAYETRDLVYGRQPGSRRWTTPVRYVSQTADLDDVLTRLLTQGIGVLWGVGLAVE